MIDETKANTLRAKLAKKQTLSKADAAALAEYEAAHPANTPPNLPAETTSTPPPAGSPPAPPTGTQQPSGPTPEELEKAKATKVEAILAALPDTLKGILSKEALMSKSLPEIEKLEKQLVKVSTGIKNDEQSEALGKAMTAMSEKVPVFVLGIAKEFGVDLTGRVVKVTFPAGKDPVLMVPTLESESKARNGGGGRKTMAMSLLASGTNAKYTDPEGKVTENGSATGLAVAIGIKSKKGDKAGTEGYRDTIDAFESNGFVVDYGGDRKARPLPHFLVTKAPAKVEGAKS